MPWLRINEVGFFSVKPDGSKSFTGHMWYQLTDDYGNMNSYGFGPAGAPAIDGPGAVNRIDSSYYTNRDYSREVWISQARYDAMKAFGESSANAAPNSWVSVMGVDGKYHTFQMHYNGILNSCVDYTWMAMEVGGLNPGNGINPGGFQGELIPQFNSGRVDDALNTYLYKRSIGADQTSTSSYAGPKTIYWDSELGVIASEIVVEAERVRSTIVADTEYSLWQAYSTGLISSDTYNFFTQPISDWMVSSLILPSVMSRIN